MDKWYAGLDDSYRATPLEKWRRAHIRARVRYEREIALGVIAGLIFLVGVVVGKLL